MLSGLEIKRQVELGNIVISDFNEKQLNPNSYNIRLGKTLKIYEKVTALDPRKDNKTKTMIIPDSGMVLHPGILYLGETEEYTETYGFVPNIDGRSTTGRLGIEVHRTAGFGDNGFKGKWTLEITVTHPVIVYPGMEIGQLYYETIDGDCSMVYDGKYQNQQGVEAAKVDRD